MGCSLPQTLLVLASTSAACLRARMLAEDLEPDIVLQ